MGLRHSTPAPSADDFLFEHPRRSSVLCEALVPKGRGETYEFTMLTNAWNKEQLVQLGHEMQLKPAAWAKKIVTRCVLLQGSRTIAVLVLDNPKTLHCQICSFRPIRNGQKSCDSHDGSSLYKWASAKKRSGTLQFDMQGDDGVNYHTDYFGNALFGHPRLVLKREGRPCSSFVRKDRGCWQVKVGPGVDPALILCFVACFDKLRESEKRNEEALFGAAVCG